MVEERRGGPTESLEVAGRVQHPPDGMQMHPHPYLAVLPEPALFPHLAFHPFRPCRFRSQHDAHPRMEKCRPSEPEKLSSFSIEIKIKI